MLQEVTVSELLKNISDIVEVNNDDSVVSGEMFIHCKMRGMIYFRMEIHPPFRHGHQLIFLIKVELFWYS